MSDGAAPDTQSLNQLRHASSGPETPTLPPEGASGEPATNGLPSLEGFEILGELGRGGMGVVYQARQEHLNRPVALKMILAGDFAGDEARRRFLAEAEVVARLQHPGIVQVHAFGTAPNGSPYFALEYLPGGSLDQKLAGTPLPPREAAALVAELADAVQAAHAANVVHRDLKPANVLLTADGTPKVTDFGLAKQASSKLTASGAILGTPSYMAPEQAAGKGSEVGPAADVYALGAILYECLTGRPPFHAETPLDTLLQVLERHPAPPRLLSANVDRNVETICLKCLEKDPGQRYGSAKALAEDLERYLAGEPITARSLNLVDRLAALLEHSQYDVQFRAYGNMLFGFATIVLLTELVVTWIVQTHQSPAVLPATQAGRVALLALVFWWYRRPALLPVSAAERVMWSLWIGYVGTCYVFAMAYRLVVGPAVELEVNLYPGLAAITGMAFFVLGSSYWGWCYAFGLGFYLLALLMALDLHWAPLQFGILWGVTLVVIGVRLRRLGSPPRSLGKTTDTRIGREQQAESVLSEGGNR
jgi:serine/threonine protein kinase